MRNGQQDSILIKLSNFIFYARLLKGEHAGVGRGEKGKVDVFRGMILAASIISQEQFLRIVSQNLWEDWHLL